MLVQHLGVIFNINMLMKSKKLLLDGCQCKRARLKNVLATKDDELILFNKYPVWRTTKKQEHSESL